jgi:hypothetical protein
LIPVLNANNLHLCISLLQAQMNDASEVLAVIFDCLHKAFVPRGALSHGELEGSSAGETWDCKDGHPCMVHGLFGLDVAEQMNCQGCELESRHLKYTAFFHNINASALRTAKVKVSVGIISFTSNPCGSSYHEGKAGMDMD